MNSLLRCSALTAAVFGALIGPGHAGVSGAGGGTTTTTVDRDATYTDRTVSSDTAYRSDIIRDRGNRVVSTSSRDVISRTVRTHVVNGRDHGWTGKKNLDPPKRLKVVTDVLARTSTSTTSLGKTDVLVSDTKVGEVYSFLRSTFDRTESEVEVSGSADLIVIGDAAYMDGQYTAQGTREVAYDVDDYYWNDLNRTDVRQRIFDRYRDKHVTTTNHYVRYIETADYVSPIVLDMDGTGTLMASSGQWLPHAELDTTRLAVFDFYGTGEARLMEWVGPKDGLLCVPKADGAVDGTCLFGISNGYEDGYEELAATRDRDGDGRVAGGELAGLFVWQDGNGNAIADPGELASAEDLGIQEIRVDHKDFKSSFVMGGRELTTWDWWPSIRGLKKLAPPRQG